MLLSKHFCRPSSSPCIHHHCPRGMVNGARYGFCNLFVVIARGLIASLLTPGHDPVVYGIKIISQCLIKILPLLRLPSTANSFDNRTFPPPSSNSDMQCCSLGESCKQRTYEWVGGCVFVAVKLIIIFRLSCTESAVSLIPETKINRETFIIDFSY